MPLRFSIFRLMELTALIAAIIAADRLVLIGGLQRFMLTFPAIGGVAGAYLGIRLRTGDSFEQIVKSVRMCAAVVSLINGSIVGVIIAEGWRQYGYFDWSRGWFQFVLMVVISIILSTSAAMLLCMPFAAYIASLRRGRQ
jgi:hypothetical protein